MIIWTYSVKYKSYGGPCIQKKVYMEPWNSHSMSRLKFKMPFDLSFSHFFSYLSWISWWFENILSNISHLKDPEVWEGSMSCLKFEMLFHIPFSHSFSHLSWKSWLFKNILSNARHLEDLEVKRRYIWSPDHHIACQFWNLKCFWSSYFPILIISIMIIWEHSLK